MNNLEKLTVEERAEAVDRFFKVNRSTITVLTLIDEKKLYGFFYELDDSYELRANFQFRFVEVKRAISFQQATSIQAKKNDTIIIDCNKLTDLRMIHANLPGEIEIEVPGFQEFLSGATKMTYRDHLNILQKVMEEKMSLYINAENKLSKENGFVDKLLLDNVVITKKKWQEAHNKYYSMLSYIKNNNINPDSLL